MKKILRLIAVLLTIALLFAGCGGTSSRSRDDDDDDDRVSSKSDKNDKSDKDSKGGEDKQKPEEPDEEEPDEPSGGIYKEAGMELYDFYEAFNGGMKRFERAINNFEPEDFTLIAVGADFLAPTLTMVSITLYDYLEVGDNPKETGKNGKYDAVREKKGNVIEFSQSKVNEEDGFSPNDKAGDKVGERGTLNTSTNSLFMEVTRERDGEVIERTILEAVILPDGTMIAQIFDKSLPMDKRIEDKGIARFIRFDRDEMEIIAANFAPDVDFEYESIFGKGDVTPEEMAEGYTKIRRLVIEDGEASAEKY
jgi:hypothetical protein